PLPSFPHPVALLPCRADRAVGGKGPAACNIATGNPPDRSPGWVPPYPACANQPLDSVGREDAHPTESTRPDSNGTSDGSGEPDLDVKHRSGDLVRRQVLAGVVQPSPEP